MARIDENPVGEVDGLPRQTTVRARRTVAVIAVAAVALGIAAIAVLVVMRKDSADDRGAQVRALLLDRGERFAEFLDPHDLETGIHNTCGDRTPTEWANFVHLGADFNVGGDLRRQMVFDASYVDVGCPDQRPNLEKAAELLGVPIPPPPRPSS
jgi:hypothetical protein